MATRAYLRSDERRAQLLAAATRLFERGGLGAISMSAVAAEAGASRRLVYDHFADLGTLYEAFFTDRVARYAAAIDAASAPDTQGGERSPGGAIRELLAVPTEDLRAIHLVMTDRATPELAPARDALRAHLQARWLPVLGGLGVDVQVAGGLLWSLATSFVTLAELANQGELDPAAADQLATAYLAALPDIVGHLTPRPVTASEHP